MAESGQVIPEDLEKAYYDLFTTGECRSGCYQVQEVVLEPGPAPRCSLRLRRQVTFSRPGWLHARLYFQRPGQPTLAQLWRR